MSTLTRVYAGTGQFWFKPEPLGTTYGQRVRRRRSMMSPVSTPVIRAPSIQVSIALRIIPSDTR